MKEIIKNKIYIRTLMADIISNFGDVLYYLAMLNYVLQIEKSNVAISIINISEMVPILCSFVIGYFADKNTKRVKTIIGTLVIRCVLYLIVALAIGFTPDLMLVVIISIINFISDILGQYENSLYYPISNRLVNNEVREEVMAFRHSLMMSLNVLFQAIGGVLICYISYRKLAIINAGSFIVSFLIFRTIKSELVELCDEKALERKKDSEKKPLSVLIKSLVAELKEAVVLLWKIPNIKETLTTIPFLNAGLAVVTPLVVLCMTRNPQLSIVNAEFTISILAISQTAGRIAGSALTVSVLKKLKLISTLKITMILLVIMFSGMIFQNLYIVIIALFLTSLCTGCIDPKMGAIIFNNLDENRLATSFGGMTTYFQIGDIISKGAFSVLVLFSEGITISIFYFIISLLSLVMLLVKR